MSSSDHMAQIGLRAQPGHLITVRGRKLRAGSLTSLVSTTVVTSHPALLGTEGFPWDLGLSLLKLGISLINWDALVTLFTTQFPCRCHSYAQVQDIKNLIKSHSKLRSEIAE